MFGLLLLGFMHPPPPQSFATRHVIVCLFQFICIHFVIHMAKIRQSLRRAGLYDRISDLQSSLQAETGTVTGITTFHGLGIGKRECMPCHAMGDWNVTVNILYKGHMQ